MPDKKGRGTLIILAMACLSLLSFSPCHAADMYRVAGVESWDSLNMRVAPDHTSDRVGSIPAQGVCVEGLGPSRQIGDNLWLHVRYQAVSGWVNSRYLEAMGEAACLEGAEAVQDGTDTTGVQEPGPAPQGLEDAAARTLEALRDRRLDVIAAMAHPDKGVRFSPYAHITTGDVRMTAQEIVTAFQKPTARRWGSFDGSGEAIVMTLPEYIDRFVYDVDFLARAEVGVDTVLGWGNTVNNIRQIYPEAMFVEYHVPGTDPAYQGMDWRSLRLVFEELDGTWFLVGVVHDEWTI